ncbi:hypothetical protein [Roseateles asaccharophilus]|uniref:Uncharacterized protein n=1 Tax=Roseateles asaccharophilus TaxID=582607 RepID=A0ABU2ABQ5_9BURK|nr:hypothetical protein [Roseateles asaccharophilus]MDR7334619.1 hypothetical protein [Roseateles asaccharophilus]
MNSFFIFNPSHSDDQIWKQFSARGPVNPALRDELHLLGGELRLRDGL